MDVDAAVKQALANRKDLQALEQQVAGAEKQRLPLRPSATPQSLSRVIMAISALTLAPRTGLAMRRHIKFSNL